MWISSTNMFRYSSVVGSIQCRSSTMSITGCFSALRKGMVIIARMVCCFCCSAGMSGETYSPPSGMESSEEKSGTVSANGRPLWTKKPSSLVSFCASES